MFARIGLILTLAMLFCFPANAAGSRNGKASISFHIQADPGDSPKMIYPMLVNGQQMAFKRVADIETKDIAAYQAVPSKKQEGVYDVVVKLKPQAAQRLQNLTNVNRGRMMASQLNGRTGEAMLINQQINDGVLVIWSVASAEDLKILAKTFKGSVETQ